MKRKILLSICAFFITLFSINVFAYQSVFPVNTAKAAACPIVPSYKDPTFCHEFKTTVLCNCDAHFPKKLWPAFCSSVFSVYTQMMGVYHSIDNACISQYGAGDQKDITECRNQWHCDIFGQSFSGGACVGNPAPNQPCPNIH